MAAHADDLLYLFDVPLPFILCDTEEVFTALAAAYQKCLLQHPLDLAAAEACVAAHDSEFKTEWGDCVDGHLTPDEEVISEAMAKTFSNFVVHG